MAIGIEKDLQNGQYRHIRRLAEGGMGEVHVVEHRALRELRVMKILKAVGPDADEQLTKRLLAEGRSMRGMRHPNIVEVLDLGLTDSGRPYLVTERLIGNTLADEIKARGRLPFEEVIVISNGILAGLTAAHQRGIVHRDLKPANLFYLEPDARGVRGVKILDFGIAKAISEEAEERAGSALVATEAGNFAGSPPYISPEQSCGMRVDARSDLYSLGAVMVCSLTGRPPFQGTSVVEYLTAHLTEAPEAPSARVAGIPEGLDAIVLCVLAKQPAERFISAEAMLGALASLTASLASALPLPAEGVAAPVGLAAQKVAAPARPKNLGLRGTAIMSSSGPPDTELLPPGPPHSELLPDTSELPTEPNTPMVLAAVAQRSGADDGTLYNQRLVAPDVLGTPKIEQQAVRPAAGAPALATKVVEQAPTNKSGRAGTQILTAQPGSRSLSDEPLGERVAKQLAKLGVAEPGPETARAITSRRALALRVLIIVMVAAATFLLWQRCAHAREPEALPNTIGTRYPSPAN